MKAFKEVMYVVCSSLGGCGLGWGSFELFAGDYQCAACVLFITSILFIVGYFTEQLSK